jgi:hypothetical protein
MHAPGSTELRHDGAWPAGIEQERVHVLGIDPDEVERPAILNVDYLNAPHGRQLARKRRGFPRIEVRDDLNRRHTGSMDVVRDFVGSRCGG